MIVPFFKPSITEREIEAVTKVLRSGWLTFGEETERFEEEFAKYIGAPYCVMVDNCTAALTLSIAYQVRHMTRQDRYYLNVGVPSLTCAATALAVLYSGMRVRFYDLRDDDSFLADFSGNGSEFYLPVHYAGKRVVNCVNNTIIVEDSAHRIVKDGFKGNMQAYSFYATKNLTTGEGGMIACSEKKEMNWLKKARLYGNSKAALERKKMYQSGKAYWWFESEFIGWKANPTDMTAALGRVQLSRLDELNEERKRIGLKYNEAFGITTDRECWHLYPMLVNKRDKFMYYMKDNGVHCSVHFPPLHMMKAFKRINGMQLPITERVYSQIVSLPLYPYMSVEEQDYVIKLTLDWIKKYGRA